MACKLFLSWNGKSNKRKLSQKILFCLSFIPESLWSWHESCPLLIISVFLETSEDGRGAIAGSQCRPYHTPVNIWDVIFKKFHLQKNFFLEMSYCRLIGSHNFSYYALNFSSIECVSDSLAKAKSFNQVKGNLDDKN